MQKAIESHKSREL